MIPTKILLTGQPGCGKTTLIRKVIGRLDHGTWGFYTREVREGAVRAGFEVVTLDGQRSVLAHLSFKSEFMVGKYGVDLASFEEVILPIMEDALSKGGIVVIDELGPMEFFSQSFCDLVWEIIRGPQIVLGTIVKRSTPFGDKVKALNGVEVIEVVRENRNDLAGSIVNLLITAEMHLAEKNDSNDEV